MSIKIEKGSIWGLNIIRWQTWPLVKNGSALELAWTIDEVHMVCWGLELSSQNSTDREWWAQLALLRILKWLNCHHIKCKQLIFEWIFHTFMGVFNILHSKRELTGVFFFLSLLPTTFCWNLSWTYVCVWVFVFVWVCRRTGLPFYKETFWSAESQLCQICQLSLHVPIGFNLSQHSFHVSFYILRPQLIIQHTQLPSLQHLHLQLYDFPCFSCLF